MDFNYAHVETSVECCGADMRHVDGETVGAKRLMVFRCGVCEQWRWIAIDLCEIDPFAITPLALNEIPGYAEIMQRVVERTYPA